ncbi:MAG: mannosyltransferase, partial [Sphingobacteriales bacterium]|nr:mannosyltransferase [Sphingobacteriales bacterium]
MTEQHLHIITHTVPWPADFGGVVDLFYKLKALYQQGVKIHLHCFTQGRKPQAALNKYCVSVNYYKRENNISSFSFTLPYIVSSRKDKALLVNLTKDNYPILIEGIHCAYLLYKVELDNRKVILRLHNVEFEYYHRLAQHEQNFFKRLYYLHESKLLKLFEKAITNKVLIAAVSKQDVTLYQQNFGTANIHFLPVFLPYTSVAG